MTRSWAARCLQSLSGKHSTRHMHTVVSMDSALKTCSIAHPLHEYCVFNCGTGNLSHGLMWGMQLLRWEAGERCHTSRHRHSLLSRCVTGTSSESVVGSATRCCAIYYSGRRMGMHGGCITTISRGGIRVRTHSTPRLPYPSLPSRLCGWNHPIRRLRSVITLSRCSSDSFILLRLASWGKAEWCQLQAAVLCTTYLH
ncbi:hypothetical protein L208DRAFT_891900 [Tricholoma matsutake]|nr:hypothetical protein L208DRAFT_891900 [Tricholoma matsutake 945]